MPKNSHRGKKTEMGREDPTFYGTPPKVRWGPLPPWNAIGVGLFFHGKSMSKLTFLALFNYTGGEKGENAWQF